MHTRGVNYWIAFADIVFMLFIVMLIAASDARRNHEQSGRELEVAKEQIHTLQFQIDRMFGCKDTKTLLQGFSACLAQNFGNQIFAESADPCTVTVGENLIRFQEGGDVPIEPQAARTVMSCLYRSAKTFRHDDPATFQAIKTIQIDGFTDCKGELLANTQLGSRRSIRLYSLLLDEIRQSSQPSEGSEVLSKFAVRSFGETRPMPDSLCSQQGVFADDRRVTISVEMFPQRDTERGIARVQ